MEILQQFLDQSEYAVLSAFIIGLMTAFSPCPMATNITAIGYISKDIENKKLVFAKGLVYTLGRAVSYVSLGVIIYLGASQFQINNLFQTWGEKLLGPLLIIIGLFMLGIIKLPGNALSNFINKIGEKTSHNIWGAFILGILFALAFCPYSGVLYFMMLMPLTLASNNGVVLPLVFAIATGIPVIIFSWLIAFALNKVGKVYTRIKTFEIWFRRIVALLFIGVGIYYIIIFFA